MRLEYVPLLKIQRDLHTIPRGMDRFHEYLRTVLNPDQTDLELAPLVIMNPMGKEHVAVLLDQLLAMDADTIAAHAAAEAEHQVSSATGDFKAALVVADDAHGGGTNRYAYEYELRFGVARFRERTTPSQRQPWIVGVLWTSEQPEQRTIREALLTSVYRVAYIQQHGYPTTLREMMAQEGHVLAQAGCSAPTLEPDDLDYTRIVLEPYRDTIQTDDMPNAVVALFGDQAGKSLGFAPQGLSPWAGIALALHEAREKLKGTNP